MNMQYWVRVGETIRTIGEKENQTYYVTEQASATRINHNATVHFDFLAKTTVVNRQGKITYQGFRFVDEGVRWERV